jgi:hypothetical protein
MRRNIRKIEFVSFFRSLSRPSSRTGGGAARGICKGRDL